ncbi:MAG: beta-lactamase family protein [Clostridia bacterium]|nr:beta-lactamase family protein [Clostridia bacterium]
MEFARLTAYLESLRKENVPQCDLTVWVDHQQVYRHFTGGLTGRETYWLHSATKVATATAALQLVEGGKLRLSDPVMDYLPAFGHLTVAENDAPRPAKTVMTVEHLLAMQGGMDYDFEAPAVRRVMAEHHGDATTRQIAQAYAEKPLAFNPGRGFRYSLCHDVLGAVMEAAAGKPLSQLMQEQVFSPLGIEDLTFHPTKAQLDRLAPYFTIDEAGSLRPLPQGLNEVCSMPRYESAGGGLMGSVDSYILLADALANGGVGKNGRQILSPAAIDDMRRDRQTGPAKEDFKRVRHKKGYGYGLGVRTLIDPASSRSPLGEFGWDGAAGAWVMMDPDHRIAAFYAQHVFNYSRTYYEFHPAIRDLIYEGLGLG